MATDWREIRKQFEIPDNEVYLNNGSFGPCPKPVLDALEQSSRLVDANPGTNLYAHFEILKETKRSLGDFVGVQPDDFVYVTNLTVGMNMIARGLRGIGAGDEILTTNHEYGAVANVWKFVADRRGATVKEIEIPAPPESKQQLVDLFERGISEKTKILCFSHITCTTGLIQPVKEICRLARESGIITVIDGAHAPGMVQLNIEEIGCDFYVGNCHKWLCGPKGTALMWAAPVMQERLDPFIVGWGWEPGHESFLGNFEHPGTYNFARPVAVADAVEFQLDIGQKAIEDRDRELASYVRNRLDGVPGARLLTSPDTDLSCSITTYSFPKVDKATIGEALARRNITLPVAHRERDLWIRVSTHYYNFPEEIDALEGAIREVYC